MADSDYLCFTKRLQLVSCIISFKGCANVKQRAIYLTIKLF